MKSETPEILWGAIRQLKHNNGNEGFVFAYEMEEVNKLVTELQSKIDSLREEFPRLNAPDIYDEKYCCEWNLDRDRKRLHEILDR